MFCDLYEYNMEHYVPCTTCPWLEFLSSHMELDIIYQFNPEFIRKVHISFALTDVSIVYSRDMRSWILRTKFDFVCDNIKIVGVETYKYFCGTKYFD